MSVTELNFYRRLTVVIVIFTFLLVLGSLGYVLIENWPWTDALYMTVITVSTVGFGETRPLSPAGRIFTVAMIVMGVGATAYTFSTVADYIVAGEFRGILRRQRMQSRIARLEDHFIICGYGRVGSQVVQELLDSGVELVVIEVKEALLEEIEHLGIISIEGNASEDAVLMQAGIERAAGLCACLPNDADNVFVALTARTLNPNLTIIARTNSSESERKLRIAGADHVINPYSISGHRMARQLVHPNVVEFMDVVMRRGELQILIEDIRLSDESALLNRTIAETAVRKTTGANILAVRRPGGKTFVDFSEEFLLQAGDTLIALGTPEQLDRLAEVADDRRRARRRNRQPT